MKPFFREPLKEFIEKRDYHEKPPQHRKKEDSVEDIIFSLIVSVFLIGVILFSGQPPTALVSYDANTEVIDIGTIYTKSTNLTFVLEGIPTSLRVTGSFIGNGSGIIFLDPFIAVEKAELPVSGGMAITGFVVFANTSNESVVENVTVEINDTNLTSNITVNETINVTVNITENITEILPNITLNFTENITHINITEINITQNITENITGNESIVPNITIELEVREFEEYCLETCFLDDITSEIVLEIILDNAILNLSHITYTYEVIEEEIIEIPPVINVTEENVTTNITEINVTVNETLNITVNETNITFNITEFNLTNVTEINLTNVTVELNLTNITVNETINLTTIQVNVSDITSLENALQQRGLQLFNYSYTDQLYRLSIGESDRNYAIIHVADLSDFVLDFVDSQDRRLNSKLFVLNNTDAELYLETDNPDVLLQCVQYSDTCKKWQISNVSYYYGNNILQANLTSGIYATADLNKTAKEYVESDYVNLNSNCWACVQESYCNYLGFTPVTNQGKREFAFQGQLGFNILDVAEDFTNVEVCAYVTYLYNDTATVNYVKNSEISYCGNPDKNYVPSNHISYAVIDKEDEWICVPIKEILQYNIGEGYSDMFLDWLGEDLNGKAIPFAMYEGMHELEYCEGYNPSGADDCRPYLKINYK